MQIAFGKKRIKIAEYRKCQGINRFLGLMFSNSSKIMVFPFNKQVKTPIHSFFCRKFVAVWIKDGKILEKRIVHPWKTYVKPTTYFDTLIEIPVHKDNKEILKKLNVNTFQ